MGIKEIDDPSAVLKAIEEFDLLGRDEFLKKYELSPSKINFIFYDDKEYDAHAILWRAHFFQTGTSISSSEFSNGEPTVRKLNQLGFQITRHIPDFSQLTFQHIESALNECDEIGLEAFYSKYATTASAKYLIVWNENRIDAKPVVVAALRNIPEYATLLPSELPGNKRTVADPLTHLGFQVVEKSTRSYWQVMHKDTAKQAEQLGVLWSPKTKTNGGKNPWYDTMARAKVGDIVYSYRDAKIHAVGVVSDEAVTALSPFTEDDQTREGWKLGVKFVPIDHPFNPTDNYEFLEPVLTAEDKKSVRAPGGTAIIGYLKEISPGLAEKYDQLAELKSAIQELMTDVEESWKSVEKFKKLGEELLLPATFLAEIDELLADKKQVIFYGPPGAGKTYVALKFAEYLSVGSEHLNPVELVQFHPSYAYEDFVEGFRPTEGGSFLLKEGKLLSIARRAIENPETNFFLVIDEINRGNVAKIFGEMYFLLEYRDKKINLQYSDDPFKMPENLFFIGTMNSADRSIGLIDSALRRRFHFVSFYPTEVEMKELLRNWLKKNAPDVTWIADAVDEVNEKIDKNFAIGPSHFMKSSLDDGLARKIWKRSILPYVEDIFFNQPEKVDDFRLERLRTLKRLENANDSLQDEIDDDGMASAAS